ncbi:MAG TPA: GNAT family N-acetyltransferase [Longimicrobiales bacterium]
MNNVNVLEVIGYAASALVAASMLMTSILRLRLVNLAGSAVFALYGLLIHAYPVAAVNLFIACVNAVHVVRMMRTREFFTIVNVVPDSDYLRFFLERNLPDIRESMPGFTYTPTPNQLSLFVVRDFMPAGLLIGELKPDGTLCVHLDYVMPGYRDLKIGKYLLEQRSDFFEERGVRRIVTPSGTALHRRYLEHMGFERDGHDLYARRVG